MSEARDAYLEDVRAKVEAHHAPKDGAVEETAAPAENTPPNQKPEDGRVLILTYAVLPGRRQEFLDLMSEARPLVLNLLRKSGGSYSLVEDSACEGRFLELFLFDTDAQRVAFETCFIVIGSWPPSTCSWTTSWMRRGAITGSTRGACERFRPGGHLWLA